MLAAVPVAMGMVAVGLYLVYEETQTAVRTGMRRPRLRNIGQLLVLMGALLVWCNHRRLIPLGR